MNVIDIEKLNQLISRTDISGNDKVRWLEDFISGRELQQQERSYSLEDLKEAFKQSRQAYIFEKDMPPIYNSFDEWFEQFKNK